MSELYLVLRRRLVSVPGRTEWVEFGGGVLEAARRKHGWSRETLARQVNVSQKTIERYEEKDAVPRHFVPRLAGVLGLEIELDNGNTLVAALDAETIAALADAIAERLRSG